MKVINIKNNNTMKKILKLNTDSNLTQNESIDNNSLLYNNNTKKSLSNNHLHKFRGSISKLIANKMNIYINSMKKEWNRI